MGQPVCWQDLFLRCDRCPRLVAPLPLLAVAVWVQFPLDVLRRSNSICAIAVCGNSICPKFERAHFKLRSDNERRDGALQCAFS